MQKEDLYKITVTRQNVATLAGIALDMKLPDDDPLRVNITNWYNNHSEKKVIIEKRIKNVQTMLNNGYNVTLISNALNVAPKTIRGLIQSGKVKQSIAS